MDKNSERSVLGRMKKKIGWSHSRSSEEHKDIVDSSASLPVSSKQLAVPDKPSRGSSALEERHEAVQGDAEKNVATQSKDDTISGVRSNHNNDESKSSTSPPEQPNNARSSTLWDLAFEQLGKADQDLIAEYQKILSRELTEKNSASNKSESQTTEITHEFMINAEVQTAMDSKKLKTIIELGLERMDKKEIKYKIAGHEFNLNDQIAEFSNLVLWGKGLIDEAVKASPEASMAWCGISLILPILTRSSETAQVHREGFYHVTARMKFYVQLEPLLFPQNQDSSTSASKGTLVDLYQRILEFQLRSVLRFFRSRLGNVGHDFACREDWTGMLDGIQKLETVLRADLDQITNTVLVKRLQSIDKEIGEHVKLTEEHLSVAKEHLAVSKSHLGISKKQLSASEKQVEIAQQLLELQKGANFKLPVVWNAIFTSKIVRDDPQCYEDTRKSIRARLIDWANDTQGGSIIWLTGHAGTGKSTISRTLAQYFEDSHRLAATYFFKRGDEARNNTDGFFPTIAAQLMLSIPEYRDLLMASVGNVNTEELNTTALDVQFEKLISTPLLGVTEDKVDKTNIIIIDALDECNKENDIGWMLDLLSGLWKIPTVRIRVLVTSRTTTIIERSFRRFNENEVPHRILSLFDDEFAEETRVDLIKFLTGRFATIKSDNRYLSGRTWPSDEDMTRIISLATTPKPLFIYASTLCQYLDGAGNPRRRLDEWLKKSTNNTAQLDEKLDEMYQIVLDEIWPGIVLEGEKPPLNPEEKEILASMLCSIVLLAKPLPAERLTELLGIYPEDAALLDCLRAVLEIPSDIEAPVKLFHKSFSDFLLRQKGESTDNFHMNVAATHAALVWKCIGRMKRPDGGLERDICSLKDYGKNKNEVDEAIITEAIPTDLEYACVYWVHHLEQCRLNITDKGKDSDQAFLQKMNHLKDIQSFLETHFLHWLEALSLLGHMSDGMLAISMLLGLLTETSRGSQLHLLVEDAHRFMLAHRMAMEEAPLQTYVSALVFSPTRSLIREQFKTAEPEWITLKPEMEENWSRCIQTLYGHGGSVRSVRFSHNDQYLASGSNDGAAKVWDVTSGACLKTLKDDDKPITSVAFSNNDNQVVSASASAAINIWDVNNGACTQRLQGYGSLIWDEWSILTQDAQKLVYNPKKDKGIGQANFSIGIRSANSDAPPLDIETHQRLSTVAVSGNSQRVVSGSINSNTIKVWDTANHGCLQTISGEHFVGRIALSWDGTLIAAPSHDHSLLIWKTSDGIRRKPLIGHTNSISSIAFSKNSKMLASGSRDQSIKIWDIDTGVCFHTLMGHSDLILSVEFSLNCKMLASGSDDGTIKIWNIDRTTDSEKLEDRSNLVTSVALSPDGNQATSGYQNGDVKTWDVQTGHCMWTRSAHKGEVRSLAYLREGRQLASGGYDDAIEIRNSVDGKPLSRLEVNSWVDAMAFSRDYEAVAVNLMSSAVIWDVNNRRCLREFDFERFPDSIAISPDGAELAVSEYPNRIQIRDIRSGETLKELKYEGGKVHSIAFSSNGMRVAANFNNCKVIIWDKISPNPLKMLEVSTIVQDISFDDTDSYLFTDIGTIPVDMSVGPNELAATFPKRCYGLSLDRTWVTWNGRKVLWLPSEYRPGSSRTGLWTIFIGASAGRTLIFRFSQENAPYDSIDLS